MLQKYLLLYILKMITHITSLFIYNYSFLFIIKMTRTEMQYSKNSIYLLSIHYITKFISFFYVIAQC